MDKIFQEVCYSGNCVGKLLQVYPQPSKPFPVPHERAAFVIAMRSRDEHVSAIIKHVLVSELGLV
ncbi:MAG TPA: hypothetical protein DCG12_08170 [Planctomycetaceae bacterium]|nr:hypothetical protein [Planctomycetaceae bacterium]